MLVHNYLVFYKVDDDEKCVYIHRIIHGSRDVASIMGGNS
jgi:plasmid stabilization system protein ParE